MARWLPPAFQKGIDIDAVDSAVDMPYDIPNFHVEYVRAEPPAVPTGFWRGVGPNNNVFAIECFMDELARKAGKDPVEFRRAMLGKTAAPSGGARSRGGEIRLGQAAAGARRARRLRAAVVRQLHRDRRRSRSRRAGRGASAPRHLGGRHRHRGQSRHRHGAAPGRPDLRPDRRALWRDHHRQGPRAAIQLPRLPHAAHRPGPEDRGARHQERRGARRHRRDRRDGGAAGAAQRDLCRDRRRLAAAADRPRPDRAGKKA